MAYRVTYSTTVTGFSTRAVRCAHCGEEFLYDVRRDAAAVESTSNGRNPDARFRASDRAHLKLQHALHSAVDPVPCPTCGLYQPDMVVILKRARGRWLRGLGMVFALFALVPCLAFFTARQDRQQFVAAVALLGGMGAALLLLGKARSAWSNPNGGDPEGRKQRGRARAYRPADADQILRDRQSQPVAEKPADVGARPLVTAVFLWLFAGIALVMGLGFVLTGADEVSDSQDSPRWPTVQGQVTQSSVVDSRPGSRRGSLTLYFQYAYTVGGKKYTSDKVRFSFSRLTEAKVRQHPRGSAVTVSYKPGDPSVCVLEPGSKFPDSYGSVLIGAGLLVLGLGFFAWGRARHGRYKELKEPGAGRTSWRETPAPVAGGVQQPLIRVGADRAF